MTQVDFYILNGRSDDALLRLASRIAEKAVAHGQKVHLNADSSAQAAKLDETLWTFSQSSFLPHRIVKSMAVFMGLRQAIPGLS